MQLWWGQNTAVGPNLGAQKRPKYRPQDNIYDVSVGEIRALEILEISPFIDESLLDWKVAAFGKPALQCMHKN